MSGKVISHRMGSISLTRLQQDNGGATVRNRTGDILITSEVLCQLSYGGSRNEINSLADGWVGGILQCDENVTYQICLPWSIHSKEG